MRRRLLESANLYTSQKGRHDAGCYRGHSRRLGQRPVAVQFVTVIGQLRHSVWAVSANAGAALVYSARVVDAYALNPAAVGAPTK
jgi:hypothetical protein